jgi:hypothetical protein
MRFIIIIIIIIIRMIKLTSIRLVRTCSTQRADYHFGPKTIRDRFDGSKDSDSSCSGWVSVANSCGYSNEH